MLGTLNLSQENSIDSNMSSDREVSPDLINHHTSSLAIIQHTTQKLQSLTQELNQSDEEPEGISKNMKRAVTPVTTTVNSATTSSLFSNENSDSYNFKPIVPEQPTVAIAPTSSTPPPQQRHHLLDEIDENTSRIVKIESYLEPTDVVDGKRAGLRIARPIPACEVNGLASADMMESVDLSGKSPSPPPPPVATASPQHAVGGGNLWHGSIETSTDTLVPLDQYSSPKRIIQLSESSGEDDGPARIAKDDIDEDDDGDDDDDDDQDVDNDGGHNRENSISLDLGSSGRHDEPHEDFATSTTSSITTQTGDSNGCDLFSDSMDKDRKTYNQGSEINQNSTPKEQTDCSSSSRLKHVATDLHQVSSQPIAPLNGSVVTSYNGKPKSSNPMDESIVIQPQFQQMEINGKSSSSENGTQHQSSQTIPQPSHPQQHQPQHTTSHHQPQNQRRRRNSSNSKTDMSPNKPTNGSISPSATNSRFSTPGARSLPLTPPSVPFSIQTPPAAALSCPDGLAHALSEQNLRLQQIVYENRLREEALQRELYVTRLALLQKTCQNCNNQQFGNDDPASLVDSMNENASNCSWEAVDERSAPSSGANSSQQITSSVLWVPDHAVSRCTTCQTEFWLGRRKHHCRSCGQIFCADCSEYWAPLSDGKLFQTVRLCGPCYQNVCGKMASSHQPSTSGSVIVTTTNSSCTTSHNYNSNSMNGSIVGAAKQHNLSSSACVNQLTNSSNNVTLALMTTVNTAAVGGMPNTLENCKHVVSAMTNTSCSASAHSGNDRETCKATTATN